MMSAFSLNAVSSRQERSAESLAAEPHVARALAWLVAHVDWVTEQQVRITEVPAPPFQEAARAAIVKKLLEQCGLKVRIDDAGNVVGERPGTDARSVVLIAAHLDTVFPAGTDVSVRRDGSRLIAPGISDNGAGLAGLVALAQALHEGKVRTRSTIVFAADVGEEGEGNLRGIRKLVDTYRGRLRYMIALDGGSIEHIVTRALASRRMEVTITGPGGHSWSDFGMPNPIHAMARGIAQFVKVRIPDEPRTTFNVGQIEGGTSVNSIPYRASIKVDLRSGSEAELERLEKALRDAVQRAIEDEMGAARQIAGSARSINSRLESKIRVLGVRPAGELPDDSPLLAAVQEADQFLGHRSRLDQSSTDANVPLSLGIHAVAIGAGGRGGGAHSLTEWYDPTDREVGLKRLLLTTVGVAGLAPRDRPSGGR